jgi:hypothetical protein
MYGDNGGVVQLNGSTPVTMRVWHLSLLLAALPVTSLAPHSFGLRRPIISRLTVATKQPQWHRALSAILPEPPTPLLPQANPFARPETMSTSGVNYQSVLNGIHELYPSDQLDVRNAMSRKDGYWPYVQKGTTPPKQLTYGEFDYYFFAELLDRAVSWMNDTQKGEADNYVPLPSPVFCDLGSGTGRLVFAAAALHPDWHLCRGIELLPGISNSAVQILEELETDDQPNHDELHVEPRRDEQQVRTLLVNDDRSETKRIPLAPIEFTCGSFLDPYVYFGDASIIFAFSSCMDSNLINNGLVQAIGRQCQPGTIVITTDVELPLEGEIPPHERDTRIPHGRYQMRFLERMDGYCWLTGGSCTAYMYRLESSPWENGRERLHPPKLSVEDVAFEVVRALEAGELSDAKAFLRNVYNNMVFYGLPESFLPRLRDD